MKRNTLLVAFLAFIAFVGQAQNDTMYVLKNGIVVNKYNVNTEVDSIIFYKPVLTTSNTVTDARDGKTYKTVKIGTQVWMAENLAYLPQVDTVTAGSEDVAGGKYYYVHGYTPTGSTEQAQVTAAKATANYQTYGVLYNWYAAMNGATSSATNPSNIQGACPTGWHLPSDAEWTELTDYLGASVAGGKLKETETTHWNSPNTGSTNETGFTALPGAYRDGNGAFSYINFVGLYLCSNEYDDLSVWNRSVFNHNENLNRDFGYYKYLGESVRCVRD